MVNLDTNKLTEQKIKNTVVIGGSKNPWHNLAIEELLFNAHTGGTVILYLWQNQNTVVIGRHQNAWKECKTDLLEEEGGRLARRTTGGGAVFHDLGNLNFTFIASKDVYNLERQLSVIIQAVSELGIEARFTGRNDIVAGNGAKFSGNAFRFSKTTGMHHGTILVNVDMAKLARYLVPSQEKLDTHAVKSVRSRVCNLSEFNPNVTIESVTSAVQEAFIREYGAAEILHENDLDAAELGGIEERLSSREWRFGASPGADVMLQKRFEWGGLQLCFRQENSRLSDVRAYSDAMDEAFITALTEALAGLTFDMRIIAEKVRGLSAEYPGAADVADWLSHSK